MTTTSGLTVSGLPAKVARRAWHQVRRVGWWWQSFPRRVNASLRNMGGERIYQTISEEELRAARQHDVGFVFGSGASLNDVSASEWDHIAQYDTIGFNEFPFQRFIRVDFHVGSEIPRPAAFAERVENNPFYRDTIFAIHGGWSAHCGNELIGYRLLRPGRRIFRYKRIHRERTVPPSRSFRDGLVHGYNSLFDTVNFAYLCGWRDIVLAGVDLYDKRYFWMPADGLRAWDRPGTQVDKPFFSAPFIVRMMGLWRESMAENGIRLWVYNPRSLLTEVLPVWTCKR